MALLFSSRFHDPEVWRQTLAEHLPELDMRVWPDSGDPADIEAALVWGPKRGELRNYPNLKVIISMGAGVEHILRDPDLPKDVPIVRTFDSHMQGAMVEYVVLHVLRYHRHMPEIAENQRQGEWIKYGPEDTPGTTVGVMGLGAFGAPPAQALASMGFRVVGWTRTVNGVGGVECYPGEDGLRSFLNQSNILVCLLPLTPDTEGILNADILAELPQGAYVINAARGGHLVEEDLLAALDSGHIAGATLDVFRQEPLPPGHPFWTHPRVTVTPHNASDPHPRWVAGAIADNLRRALAGEELLNSVDAARGY